ncbi:hypothetical protein [Biostraticola tofi]|uniref:hypothetical protein n=1 Tax=Biostraticola tofi TaxID=466109 RepID=UPI0010462391|nr:hypothetical protein [Biostraticola tofi]
MDDLAYPEKQHIRYLNGISKNGNISLPISETEAINEVQDWYGTHFINNVTFLNLSEEIINFNLNSAFAKANFIDWFSFRDFKEDGYIRINNFLRNVSNQDRRTPLDVFQLKLSLMHQMVYQSTTFSNNLTLMRGEIRPSYVKRQWHEGSIFSAKTFMSTSRDEAAARTFCGPKDALKYGQIYVFYTITNNNPYAGANISDILCDGEEEYVFLPNTEFVITSMDYDKHAKVLSVGLSTCQSNSHEFTSRLHELVFSTK